MRDDFPFFRSFDERGERLADDVRLLAAVAEQGLRGAAKDISMAGLVGSLAMLLEWGAFGASIDLAALPSPAGIDLGAAGATASPASASCSPASRRDAGALRRLQRRRARGRAGRHARRHGPAAPAAGDGEVPVFDLAEHAATGLARDQG